MSGAYMDAANSLVICTACNCPVPDDASRALHYRSEWHRYNIKRRCAGLTPIPEKLFNEKLAVLQARKGTEGREKEVNKCAMCGTGFNTPAAYQTHLQSKKHQKRAAKRSGAPSPAIQPGASPAISAEVAAAPGGAIPSLGAAATAPSLVQSMNQLTFKPAAAEKSERKGEKPDAAVDQKGEESKEEEEGDEMEADMDMANAIPLKTCLFCNETFEKLDSCVQHMLKQHGFFIPFVEYLADLEGLLGYLGAKIGAGKICLYCNGRGRARYPTLHAVQQHMVAKHHCKLRLDTEEEEEEFVDFYEFPEAAGQQDAAEGEDDGEEGGMVLDMSDEPGSEAKKEGDKSAAASDKASSATKDEPADKTDKSKQLIVREKPRRTLAGMTDNGELRMSDGALIGHRAFKTYYRQNLRPRESRESVLINQMLNQYRALALPGYSAKGPQQKNERTVQIERMAVKHQLKASFSKNDQKHYRAQIM